MLLVGSILSAQEQATGREFTLGRSQWKLFIPEDYQPPTDRSVNLLVHFHGDPQTIWNNAAQADVNAVVVTVNYSGLSSAYSGPFADRSLFRQLLDTALASLRQQADFGPETDWDQLAVSSFSAGYGAVRQILSTPAYFNEIDSLLAADSLYATTSSDGTALDSQMVNYKAFASAAADGTKQFIFTHSEVPTFTYESTAETGDELLEHLGLTASAINESGLGPLQYYRKAERGGFQLWGARGADGTSHLNHLRYIAEWFDDLDLSAALLPGDYNGDGAVDAADYTVWRDNWLAFGAPGDGDGDGFTGNTDFDIWQANYGAAEPEITAESVPEPGATALLFLGGSVVAIRSR